jgi:hypothetical protein
MQPPHTFPPLPCSTIVYRAMLRKQWIDKRNNYVTPAAFIRRPKADGRDSKGLSVDLAHQCTIDEVRGNFNSCFGIVTLHVGHIRDVELDVIQDTPKHGNITGLPYQEDNEAEAERLAGLLAKQARIVWQP